MFNWQNFWDMIFGCGHWKELLKKEQEYSAELNNQLELCFQEKADLKETIRQLELLVPRPPPPKLDYIIEKDDAWVEAQLKGMGLNIVRLRLDDKFRLTNRKNFVNVVAYDTTDRLEYIKHFFDCEDFMMMFKVMTHLNFGLNQMAGILDYKSGHAYILVLFVESEHMILETESDAMYLWTKRLTDFYSLEGAIALI